MHREEIDLLDQESERVGRFESKRSGIAIIKIAQEGRIYLRIGVIRALPLRLLDSWD
jgi:hypothetical protein